MSTITSNTPVIDGVQLSLSACCNVQFIPLGYEWVEFYNLGSGKSVTYVDKVTNNATANLETQE